MDLLRSAVQIASPIKPPELDLDAEWAVLRGSAALAKLTTLEVLAFKGCVHIDAEHMPLAFQ